jgi:hypothetical protein
MCRQSQQRDAALPSHLLHRNHQLPPDTAAARVRGDADALHLGSMVGIRGTAQDELGHREYLLVLLGHEQHTITA